MFGRKTKRIKELEEELKILNEKWGLDAELKGINVYYKELTRSELIKELIDARTKQGDSQRAVATLMLGQEGETKLKKTISDLRAEIETLKSKLTRKKPIKKSEQ